MNITELEREDSRGNGTRRGSMSQDINHFYFHNIGESVGGDWIGGDIYGELIMRHQHLISFPENKFETFNITYFSA